MKAGDDPAPLLGRYQAAGLAAVVTDLVIVVLGIVIGLQASQWVQTRQDIETERRYLKRLLADSDANVGAFRRQSESTTDAHLPFRRSLLLSGKRPGPRPGRIIQRDVPLVHSACSECSPRHLCRIGLVRTARVAPRRRFRGRLALEQAAHDEAERLDILAPAIFQVAAPLSDYRKWRIVGAGSGWHRRRRKRRGL